MLTARQRAVYNFILQFRRAHLCSPSIPEIQRAFRFRSPNAVTGHLRALETKGYVRRANRGSRFIDIADRRAAGPAAPLCHLPMFGLIAAGFPEPAPGAPADGSLTVDEISLGFRPKPGCFALKVRGDSMKDAGIFEGDLVVVEPTPVPRAGQIVVALVDGESTLKRLVRVDGKWFLKAENPAYPRLHPRADLVIQGVVRAVIRRLG